MTALFSSTSVVAVVVCTQLACLIYIYATHANSAGTNEIDSVSFLVLDGQPVSKEKGCRDSSTTNDSSDDVCVGVARTKV